MCGFYSMAQGKDGGFNELLIVAVSKKPAIWDPVDRNHRCVNVVDKLWRDVAVSLGCDGK